MPVDIPQLSTLWPDCHTPAERDQAWTLRQQEPGDFRIVCETIVDGGYCMNEGSQFDERTLDAVLRAVVEAPTILWCVKHDSAVSRDQSECHWNLWGRDIKAVTGKNPCVIKPMLLVDPGSQP